MKREGPLLKGCQKRILHIKNTDSALFEEAYFILKPANGETKEDDMVKEAERILKSASLKKKKHSFLLTWEDLLIFLAGILLSFIIFGIAALFLTFRS